MSTETVVPEGAQGDLSTGKSDLVERARNRLHDAPMETERLIDDMADEIERLRANRIVYSPDAKAMSARVERLCDALADLLLLIERGDYISHRYAVDNAKGLLGRD